MKKIVIEIECTGSSSMFSDENIDETVGAILESVKDKGYAYGSYPLRNYMGETCGSLEVFEE
jgi:hypothetical protein